MFDLEKELLDRALQIEATDVSFGTLWWVDEDLWIKLLPHYDENSTRDGHPGVSVHRGPVSFFERVPLLHGTSGDCGPVVVKLKPDEPEHQTVFGLITKPARIGMMEFTDYSQVHCNVVPWEWKQRLDQDELAALKAWNDRRREYYGNKK